MKNVRFGEVSNDEIQRFHDLQTNVNTRNNTKWAMETFALDNVPPLTQMTSRTLNY